MLRRLLPSLLAVAAASALAAGCGGGEERRPTAPGPAAAQAAPGELTPPTADGRSNEAAASGAGNPIVSATGERTDVRRQRPCSLVSKAAATKILGVAVHAPSMAPQGPTCVYRSRDGKQFVSLSVRPLDFATLRKELQQATKLEVADHTAYCGMHGQPMLYADVADGFVLSVAGPCALAQRFAGAALGNLVG